MAGRPAYPLEHYRTDIRLLQSRGWTAAQIAKHLGMSRATYFRLLGQLRRR
jgi:DNA-binding IclR family transcriptional regulator